MNKSHPSPTVKQGALVGLLLTTPLIALFYLGAQVFSFPFIPFDVFDWLGRVLPGGLVTFGIDLIVSIIAGLNLEDTSRSAKTAEHILALLILLAIGAAVGAALFTWLRRESGWQPERPGWITGITIGVIVALISGGVNQTAAAGPVLSLIWIVGIFVLWGIAHLRVYNRLVELPPPLHPSLAGIQQVDGSAQVEVMDRRRFIVRLGGSAAAFTVIGAGLGSVLRGSGSLGGDDLPQQPTWSSANVLPNADAALMPVTGTRPEFTSIRNHYRIDINSFPPVLREDSWTLDITGLARNPLRLTLDDLKNNYEPLHQFITLSCISNPVGGDLIGTQRWTGVSLQRILADAEPAGQVTDLLIRSSDGFYETLSRALVESDPRIMLCYAWDGLPLTTAHGFPLRLYIPDRYGMKQPKWINEIELADHYEEGYWVRRGWDELAQVKITAVIDTIAVDNRVEVDGRSRIPIGGIAYGGARGIQQVEVQIDQGDWQPAELRTPISDLTWVIWRYDWPFEPGDHLISVRCTDGRGIAQIVSASGERPSGATGLHRRRTHV